MAEVADVMNVLKGADDKKGSKQKGSAKKDAKSAAKDSAAKPGKKEAPKAKDQRQKEYDALEAKMAQVVRPGKDTKHSSQAVLAARKEIAEYLRTTVVEHMIEAAFCYGESLGVCRTVQRRFETRPVSKYLFPMIREFQFGVQGVLPKSLQSINNLGQVMCLDSESQLNQFDVATAKSPSPSEKARYPLAEAKIQVMEIPGNPGAYNAVAWLRPWLQLEELNASLRMVASIPKGQG